MHAWESSRDEGLRDLTRRVRVRSLFKTYELFGEQAKPEGRAARARHRAPKSHGEQGFDPDVHVGVDVASDVPFEAARGAQVVYAKGPARPLSEVSFLLSRLKGETLERVRLLFAPELRGPITAALSEDAPAR